MLQKGKRYLFMTLSYYFSGVVRDWNPGHAVLDDVRVHYEDVGPLDEFKAKSGTGKSRKIANGTVVPIPGSVMLPLADDDGDPVESQSE